MQKCTSSKVKETLGVYSQRPYMNMRGKPPCPVQPGILKGKKKAKMGREDPSNRQGQDKPR